jgi:[amino-group carrier protein]-gamma-(L-lysyl/L-ornithyl)-L-glutamate aminotransferase
MGHDLTTTHARLTPIPLHAGRGLTLVRGEGSYLWDDHDRRYLDLMTNYGVNLLGHTHPAVTAAITAQAARLTNAHQSFDNPAREEFLQALGALLPPPLTKISFGNSGAEAIEAALKYARVASGRTGIIATHRAYHGRTFGALAATADAKYRDPFAPMLEGVRHIPFDDLDALDKVLDDSVGAVIIEPIQGEGGVRVPAAGYLKGIRERCDAHGILLICDEIQTGFRTGAVFAFSREDIMPDILCLSKSIANGLPLGVTVTTEAVSDRIPKGSHGSTFAGNPLVCAAGTATLRVLADETLHARARQAGDRFQERVRGLGLPQVREVRGRGLMLAVELKKPATPVIKAMQERGTLALPGGGTVIRFLPSILIDDAQLDEGIEVLAGALRQAG